MWAANSEVNRGKGTFNTELVVPEVLGDGMIHRTRQLDTEVLSRMARMNADSDDRRVGLSDLARAIGAERRDLARSLNRLLVQGSVGKVLRGRSSGYFLIGMS